MGIVIEDREFDPALRESIATYVAERYVDPDSAEQETRGLRLDRAESYESASSMYDIETGELLVGRPPISGYGTSAPEARYYEEPIEYCSAMPAAAPSMAEPDYAARSAPKRKAGLLDTASELVEKVRESVTSPKRESKREVIEDEFADAEALEPGDTVRFAPIRLEKVELEGVGEAPTGNLQDWLDQVDESFSTTLLMLIDRKGLTDVDVYKRANMSRQLFSRIRSDALYRPAKKTVLALGIAMKLSLDELCDLLQRAGYALSHSSKRDLIVEYFVTCGEYNLNRINEALYEFDQPLI